MDEYERRLNLYLSGYKTSGQRWVEDLERKEKAADAFGAVVFCLILAGTIAYFVFG